MTIFLQMWSLYRNILLWCYIFLLWLELLMKTLLHKTDLFKMDTLNWSLPFFSPLLWLSVRWASLCLVPVWHLSKPLRSMHFGDVSETNGHTLRPEMHQPPTIMRPIGTRQGISLRRRLSAGLNSDFLKSLRKALISDCSCKWPQWLPLLWSPNLTFPLFISSHKQPLRILFTFINTSMKLHTKLMVPW